MTHGFTEGKIANAEVAAKADEDPPLDQLMRLLKDGKKEATKGESVVYWMRMEDMRGTCSVLTLIFDCLTTHTSSRGQHCTGNCCRDGQGAQSTTHCPVCAFAGRLSDARS